MSIKEKINNEETGDIDFYIDKIGDNLLNYDSPDYFIVYDNYYFNCININIKKILILLLKIKNYL